MAQAVKSPALLPVRIRWGSRDRRAYVFSSYGGTGHKFCRFHKRGSLSSLPVEPTKLMPYTSVIAQEDVDTIGDCGLTTFRQGTVGKREIAKRLRATGDISCRSIVSVLWKL